MGEFRMPSLGAEMEAGTVVQWLVKPGDAVKRGDIVAVVDTEKADIEIEVFESGIVQSIVTPQGQKVPIGTVLALIVADAEALQGAPAKPPSAPAAPPPPPAVPPQPRIAKPPMPKPAAAASGRWRVSPLAMRVASELHVDLSAIEGTGPGGAITKVDVERTAKAAKAPLVAPPPAQGAAELVAAPGEAPKVAVPGRARIASADRLAAMRKVIGAAMARSKREIPHYYLGTRIDMSAATAWLQAENLKRPVTNRLLYSVLLLKAVALAIQEVPEMNGFFVDGAFRPSETVHVGVAIALRQGGLIAPAIHNLDKKTLDEIMAKLRDLVNRVRAGTMRGSEIADPTITVTSLGERSVETVFGVIYPPQVALVGFGKITECPWAANGMVGVRPAIMATLAADHRASDGHRGALFLSAIERLLQEPERL